MSVLSLQEYALHIKEKMSQTKGNVAIARSGQFSTLGCIDSEVQKVYPTGLVVAGSLAFWALDQRGGARLFLENLADLGNDSASFELHFPCGELLLEHGIKTFSGQERFTNGLVRQVKQFNTSQKTNFDAIVHTNIGTAGPYLK